MMADDQTQTVPRNPSRIAIGENYEIAYWSQKFDVSPEQLREAVIAVGNFAAAVEEYLQEHVD